MNKKELVLFGDLTIKEKVAIADYLGVKTNPYEITWRGGKNIYIFTDNAIEREDAEIALDMPFPSNFILLSKRLEDIVYQTPNPEEIFNFDRDALRFSKEFIKHVKRNAHTFQNIAIGCISGEKFKIVQDYLGCEELQKND